MKEAKTRGYLKAGSPFLFGLKYSANSDFGIIFVKHPIFFLLLKYIRLLLHSQNKFGKKKFFKNVSKNKD
ncbi:MAG TPA: hypothetical protein VJ279_11100 [Hanamia sp.]|nr:hypothetical protein [Hanamia sp.]